LFQQKAREIASAETIMLMRTALATPILFLIAHIAGAGAPLSDFKAALMFLVINGVFLLGLSKILWIEAIHRISVTKANALSILTPLFTLLLAWLVFSQAPTFWQLLSLMPMLAGVLLLTGQISLSRRIQA
jgi:drug/metabolite transporter (DMT)-like permease